MNKVRNWALAILAVFAIPLFAACGEDTTENRIYVSWIQMNSGYESISLALDSGATFRLDESTYTVMPTEATNKSVSFHSNNENVVRVNGDGTLIPVDVGTTSVIISSQDNSSANPAVIEVRVVASRQTLSTPTGLVYDGSTLTWARVTTDSSFIPSYRLDITKDNVQQEPVIVSTNSYTGISEGVYRITVTALGNESMYINSSASTPINFTQLGSPTDFTVSAEGDLNTGTREFTLSFKLAENTDSIDDYEYTITPTASSEYLESDRALWDSAIASATISDGYAYISIPNNLSQAANILRFRATQDISSGIYSGSYSNGITISKLSAPQNLSVAVVISGGEQQRQLTWSSVQNATQYKILIRYTLNTGQTTDRIAFVDARQANSTMFNLNNIVNAPAENTYSGYEAYVFAIGSTDSNTIYIDSDSSVSAMMQLNSPEIAAPVANIEDRVFEISWSSVNNANAYAVYVSNNSSSYVSTADKLAFTTSATSCEIGFDQTYGSSGELLWNVGDNYIKIVALAAAGSNYSDSLPAVAPHNFMKLATVSDFKVSYGELMWTGVDDASEYVIEFGNDRTVTVPVEDGVTEYSYEPQVEDMPTGEASVVVYARNTTDNLIIDGSDSTAMRIMRFDSIGSKFLKVEDGMLNWELKNEGGESIPATAIEVQITNQAGTITYATIRVSSALSIMDTLDELGLTDRYYTFKIRPVNNMDSGSQYVNGNFSTSINTYQMLAPTGVRVTDGVITWDRFEDEMISNNHAGIRYRVMVNDQVYTTASNGNVIGIDATSAIIAGLSDNTRYTISLQVTIDSSASTEASFPITIDENTYIINSPYSNTITARILPKPAQLSIRDYTLSWTASGTLTNNYLIQLYSINSEGQISSTPLWEDTVTPSNANSPSYNFSTVLTNEINFIAGRYQFFIYSLGNTGQTDAYINSYVSNGLEIYKLETPQLQVDGGNLHWNTIYSNLNGNPVQVSEYTIYVENGNDHDTRTFTVSGTSTTLSELPQTWYDCPLNISIQARSGNINLIYDSEISSAYIRQPSDEENVQITVQKLSALTAEDITVTGNSITWTNDDLYSSASYRVMLYSVSDTGAAENLGEVEVYSNTYTLPERNGGKYFIRIQRIGYTTSYVVGPDEQTQTAYRMIDSEYSEAIYFMRFYDPVGLQMTVNDEREPVLTWNVSQDDQNSRFKVTVVLATNVETRYEYYVDYNTKQLDLYNTQSYSGEYLSADKAGTYRIYISTVARLEGGNPLTTITQNGITYFLVDSRTSSQFNATIFEAPTFTVNGSTLNFVSSNAYNRGMNLIFTPLVESGDTLTESAVEPTINITLPSNVSSYEINVGNFQAGRFYKVQIQALGNSSNLIDSAMEVNSALVYKLEPLNANTVTPTIGEDGKATNTSEFDGWYIQDGMLYWPTITGVQTYNVYAVSENVSTQVIERQEDGSQIYESSVSGLDYGIYGLQFRLIGGRTTNDQSVTLNGESFDVAYLSSDLSTAVNVNKLFAPNYTYSGSYTVMDVNGSPDTKQVSRSTAYAKIINGEFDFGVRDENGVWTDNTGATSYRLTINGNDWKIDYNGINETKEQFIATDVFTSRNDYVIRLYSIGNNWYGTNDADNNVIYLTSDAGNSFTIRYGGQITDLKLQDGALTWDTVLNGSVSGYDLSFEVETEGSQVVELNGNTYSFDNYDAVKGSVINNIMVRFSGVDTTSPDAYTGYVNSAWSSPMNNVYKLPDLGDNGLNDQYLYINDRGQLAWNANEGIFGELLDELQFNIARTVYVDSTVVNPTAIDVVDLNDLSYDVPVATGIGDLKGVLMYNIEAYIQGTQGTYEANNNDDVVYLNSDSYNLSATKLNTPVSFTLDTANGSVRVNWDLTNCSVSTEEQLIDADEILLTYTLSGSTGLQTYRVDVYDYSIVQGIYVTGQIPFWTLGTFNNLQLTVVNSEGLAFGSSAVSLSQSTVVFNYFYGGSGTRSDPFIIQSTEEYTALEQLEMAFWLPDVYFKFNEDIVLPDLTEVQALNPNATSNIPYPNAIVNEDPNVSVTYSSLMLTGGWDGNGKTISNYQVAGEGFGIWNGIYGEQLSEIVENDAYNNWTGVIKNLNVEVNTIDVSNIMQVYNGIITQSCYGLIYDCHVTGDAEKYVAGGSTVDTIFKGTITGLIGYEDGLYFGGIAGVVGASLGIANPDADPEDYIYSGTISNIGRIENCTNTLDITVLSGNGSNLYTYVGGIAGLNSMGYIVNCTNGSTSNTPNNYGNLSGYVAGGIVGENAGLSVTIQPEEGSESTDNTRTFYSYVTGCTNYGEINSRRIIDKSGQSASGGIAGMLSYGYVTFSINHGVVTTDGQNAYLGGIVAVQNIGGHTLNVVNMGMIEYNAYYNETITTSCRYGAIIGVMLEGTFANSNYELHGITVNGSPEITEIGYSSEGPVGAIAPTTIYDFGDDIEITTEQEFITETNINDITVTINDVVSRSDILNIDGQYAQFAKTQGEVPTIIWVTPSDEGE